MDEVDSKNCQICKSEVSKYVCPRCGIPYCSLKCYKDEQKHLQCSETFYKNCVMDDLKTQPVKDPEAAKKMTQVLQKFREQFDQDGDENEEGLVDSDDDEPLEKRLEGINLDDSDNVWSNLTEEERNEFKKLVQDVNNVRDIVPEWTAWWTIQPDPINLIEEIDDLSKVATKNVKKAHVNQPEIMYPIPLMSSLTRVKPNDHVKIGLTNVIAAYVWTSRLYNGEFLTYEEPEEVAGALISLSSFLGKDVILSTFEHALADVSMNACRNPDLFDGGPALQSTLNRDVFTILSGPLFLKPKLGTLPDLSIKKTYILSALSECYNLLSKAVKKCKSPSEGPSKKSSEEKDSKSTFKKSFKQTSSISIDPKVLTKVKRKIHYLLAFANEFDVL